MPLLGLDISSNSDDLLFQTIESAAKTLSRTKRRSVGTDDEAFAYAGHRRLSSTQESTSVLVFRSRHTASFGRAYELLMTERQPF